MSRRRRVIVALAAALTLGVFVVEYIPPFSLSSSPVAFSSSGSCDVIAAEFQAASGVAALLALLPKCRLFVYSKSHSCDEIWRRVGPASLTCVDLPNVGRETHTWVLHVLTHYNDLAARVYFVPLPIFDSGRMRNLKLIVGWSLKNDRFRRSTRRVHVTADGQFACVIANYSGCYQWKPRRDSAAVGGSARGYDRAKAGSALTRSYNLSNQFVTRGSNHTPACLAAPSRVHVRGFSALSEDCTCFSHRVCGAGGLPSPARTSPLGPWAAAIFGNAVFDWLCHVPICNSGLFAATRAAIHGQQKSTYEAVLAELNSSQHPEAGYFVERLLGLLFAPLSIPLGRTCGATAGGGSGHGDGILQQKQQQPGGGRRCETVSWKNPLAISRGRDFHELGIQDWA